MKKTIWKNVLTSYLKCARLKGSSVPFKVSIMNTAVWFRILFTLVVSLWLIPAHVYGQHHHTGTKDLGVLTVSTYEQSPSLNRVPSLPSKAEVLHISNELKQLIDDHLEGYTSIRRRSERLHQLLFDPAYQNIQYSPNATHTAHEAFIKKTGNCIGLSNLFVAAARYAGLNAHYQSVEVPRQWQLQESYFIVPEHMNVGIFRKEVSFNPHNKRSKRPAIQTRNYLDNHLGNFTRNFNQAGSSFEAVGDEVRPSYVVEFVSIYARRNIKGIQYTAISDEQALAEYYNNLAVDQLELGYLDHAVEIFKTALGMNSKASFIWSNLGYTYKRKEWYDDAEKAYLKAFSLNKKNYSAVKNLYVFYDKLGQHKKALRYKKRVDRYNQKNPYYHQALADQYLALDDFKKSIYHYRKMIKLVPSNNVFHHKIAIAYYKAGKIKASQKHLKKAHKLSTLGEQKLAYQGKLDSLNRLYGHSTQHH